MAIRREVYGEEHPEVAHSLHLLANLMFHQHKNHGEAEKLYQRALKMRERYYDRNSDRVAQTLHNMADLAKRQGRDDRAEELYRECLQIREGLWGGPHPETIKTAEQLLR